MSKSAIPHRRRDADASRRAIIDAAIATISEQGYSGFTIHDIARRCGLTNGGLLYHFKTKEDLFVAVLADFERRTELSLGAVNERFAGEPGDAPSRSKAVALLRGMVEQSAAAPELMRLFAVLQAEALHRDHPGYEYFDRLQDRIVAGFCGIVKGLSRNPERTARSIYAVMIGLEYQWLRTAGGFDYLGEWDRAIAKLLPDSRDEGEG